MDGWRSCMLSVSDAAESYHDTSQYVTNKFI